MSAPGAQFMRFLRERLRDIKNTLRLIVTERFIPHLARRFTANPSAIDAIRTGTRP